MVVQTLDSSPYTPKAKPTRTYHDLEFLRILDAKNDAITNNQPPEDISLLNKQLSKAAQLKKKQQITQLLESKDAREVWQGVKRQKPFQATNCRVLDTRGHPVPTLHRAQYFANYYAGTQWLATPRDQLLPLADISTLLFLPAELRAAIKRLKRENPQTRMAFARNS